MIQITRHRVSVPHLTPAAKGLCIAHLTDFHRDPCTPDARLRAAVEITNQARPDIIVLTGDYITHRVEDVVPCAAILSGLRAPLGVWGILGNHDYRVGPNRMHAALADRGICMLSNSHVWLENGLYLGGISEMLEDVPDLEATLHGVPHHAPLIMLCHNPAQAETFSHIPCVALSGHTHGGQVVVPILTAWKVRRIHAKHYRAGWFDVGRVRLYVNRGLGNTLIPFRFLAPPEIALFTLE